MATALAPTPPALPEPRFANPVTQITGLITQPAVRRSLPLILLIGLIAVAALAWTMLAAAPQKTLFAGLPDADKAQVVSALKTAGITATVDDGTDAVTVDRDDYSKARLLLASQGLPKSAPGGYAILDNLPMGTSRAVEGERLRQARETELARSIEEIDGVSEARVHLAMPDTSVFVRDSAAPSASVVVKLGGGRVLADAQVSSIVNLVASSVPGMRPESVTVVDGMGAMLTKSADGTTANDARIKFQQQIEQKYRDQLSALLTPLVGPGNFTAQVSAEVDLDETAATKEVYDKTGTIRTEQGQWTKSGGDGQAPGGIPGALSNTPPPASTLAVPTPTPTPTPGAAPAPGATVSDAEKQSDSYARAYDLGKEVSVTRGTPGAVKRLSVAVLLRDPDKGRPRGAADLQQITSLVQTAVGYDQNRNDQVTVISKKFAGGIDTADTTPWYEQSWVGMVARYGSAVLITLLVLLFGVRPITKALLKKREDAMPRAPQTGRDLGSALGVGPDVVADAAGRGTPIGVGALAGAQSFDQKIGAVRGFTRDNPTRAALAVRDMIRS